MTSTPAIWSAALGALPGLGLWLLLRHRHASSPLTLATVGRVLVAVGLACRVAFALLTPAFYAPDEQPHYRYVAYVAETHTLPVLSSRTEAPSNDWEYYQPPLYYLALAPLYTAVATVTHSEAVTLRALRLVSIALWLFTVWTTRRTLATLRLHPVDHAVILGVLCLLPAYTFLSSVVNNDNLLLAVGSLVVDRLVRRDSPATRPLVIGGLLGLALLSKLTAVVYIVLALAIAVARAVESRTPWYRALPATVPMVLVALLVWAPWGWRNWALYGSLTAEEAANVPYHWTSTWWGVVSSLRYMVSSFWAVSGVQNNVRGFYPVVGALITLAAAGGLARGALRHRGQLDTRLGAHRYLMLAMAATVVVGVGLVLRFGLLYGQGQGRFLYPCMLPAAWLMAIGLDSSGSSDALPHVAGLSATYALSFMTYSLVEFTRL